MYEDAAPETSAVGRSANGGRDREGHRRAPYVSDMSFRHAPRCVKQSPTPEPASSAYTSPGRRRYPASGDFTAKSRRQARLRRDKFHPRERRGAPLREA
jgi:hypothetical protein